jgi:proteasome lid subunit RPN8/RPN11
LSTPLRLLLPRQLYDGIVRQARAAWPNECCGFLYGLIEGAAVRAVERYPLTNIAGSPSRYEADARELFLAERHRRTSGLEAVAIYHSHPTSAPIPSRTDRERNMCGEAVVHLILSLQSSQPELRAWRLREHDQIEVPWELVPGTPD